MSGFATISQIRDAVADVLREVRITVPDGSERTLTVLPRPSEKAPSQTPVCWIDYRGADVVQGSRSEHKHKFSVTVVIFRKGNIDQELAYIERTILPIEAAFETHYTLGDLCSGFHLVSLEPGEVTYAGGDKYIGVTFRFLTITRRVTELED